jgi:8-oxo-dGTP pyrophosphatase MutT (NUDIX family)
MTDRPARVTVSLRGVLFDPDDDVLVVRRAADGGWELPGGRLGSGEDVVPSLRRETREETGLRASVTRPVHTVAWRNDRDEGRFGVYYHATVDGRDVTLSREHTDHAWLPPARATERLSEPQGAAVERAREVQEA